jgi:hypothetical protein
MKPPSKQYGRLLQHPARDVGAVLKATDRTVGSGRADDGARGACKGQVEVAALFMATGRATMLRQAKEGALYRPSVAFRMVAAPDAVAGDTQDNAACAALAVTAPVIIDLCRRRAWRAAARPALISGPQVRHRVRSGHEHAAVAATGPLSVRPNVPWAPAARGRLAADSARSITSVGPQHAFSKAGSRCRARLDPAQGNLHRAGLQQHPVKRSPARPRATR